jgi:hypothetical protein
MNQPVPKVSDDDVTRIALWDFGEALASQALSILREFGQQDWNQSEIPRVRLAILKLANGDLKELSRHAQTAIQDFRDVLAPAEYPRWTAEIGFDDAPKDIERSVIKDDWKQYREWLERK